MEWIVAVFVIFYHCLVLAYALIAKYEQPRPVEFTQPANRELLLVVEEMRRNLEFVRAFGEKINKTKHDFDWRKQGF
jgi:hypothetical protein